MLIVTYNNGHDIDGLLDSLRLETRENRLRVVVADNGSGDDTLARARAHEGVIAFSTGGNLGYAGGLNAARDHAGVASALLVLNADLVVEPGAIRALRECLDTPGTGCVVPRLTDRHGAVSTSLRREPSLTRALGDALLGDHVPGRPGWLSETDHDADSYHYAHPIDWATGAAMLISAKTAEAVGDWDERYFLYSEEVDLCRRVRAAGFSVWFEPRAVMRHTQGGSGASAELSALLTVNRVRYVEAHHSRTYAAAFRALVWTGETLRAGTPGHDLARHMLADRLRWNLLPQAQTSGRPAWLDESFPHGSVVIPAHNEAGVIGRTLQGLAPLAETGLVEVVVVCNGCDDDTAEVAGRFPGVKVVEITEASKIAALNAADDEARTWPRLYLDADVDITPRALRDLFHRLDDPEVLTGRPAFEYDVARSSRLVRRYYRARSRLAGTETQLWGAGAYAMTEKARSCFGAFPEVTADDLFVDALFAEHDKTIVETVPVVVRVPRDVAGLVKVLRRTYRGNQELARMRLAEDTTSSTAGALARSVRGPGTALDALVYAGVVVAARIGGARHESSGWERDDSSRT